MHSIRIPWILIVALPLGFVLMQAYSLYRIDRGYELEHNESADFLQARLREDFGYSGFDDAWLQNTWVNGFQDHTYLFLVDANSNGLRDTIEKATGEDPIQPTFFGNGNYLGPSKAPVWWDTSRIDAAESRYFEKNSNFWRFTWLDSRLYIVYCN